MTARGDEQAFCQVWAQALPEPMRVWYASFLARVTGPGGGTRRVGAVTAGVGEAE